MGFIKDFKLILKPILVGIALFMFTFLTFTTTYVYIEYQSYLLMYERTQEMEVKDVQQKASEIFGKLKELHQLTSARIVRSQDDLTRIQNILSSTPRLYAPQELPKIQKLSYYKLSTPQNTITRFGIFPLKSEHLPITHSAEKEPTITFPKDVVLSKTSVFNDQGTIEGTLEVQIALSDFKALLGNKETISFDPFPASQTRENQVLQKYPFIISPKKPTYFLEYISLNKNHYAVFLLYTFVYIILLIIYSNYINIVIKRTYKNILQKFRSNRFQSTLTEEKMKESLIVCEQKYKSYRTSYQSYKKIHAILNIRQREHALHIYRFIDIAKQSLKDSKIQLSQERLLAIIQACLKLAQLLADGIVSRTKKEPINLKSLFEDIESFFAEKIYKSNSTLEFACSENLVFYGDSLFIKLILMNMIGKAIHRIPKNGNVLITATQHKDDIYFRVRDNGFSLVDSSEKLIKKSFNFFIAEDVLQKMCNEANLRYKYSKDDMGFNITEIIIPTTAPETSASNVIQIFKGMPSY